MDQYPQYSAASSSDVRLGRGPEVTQYQSSYAVPAPDEQLWPFGAPSILPPPALSIHAQGPGMPGPSVRPGSNHLHTWSGAQMPSINEHEPGIIGTAGPTYTAVSASRTPSNLQSGTWYDPFVTTPVQPVYHRTSPNASDWTGSSPRSTYSSFSLPSSFAPFGGVLSSPNIKAEEQQDWPISRGSVPSVYHNPGASAGLGIIDPGILISQAYLPVAQVYGPPSTSPVASSNHAYGSEMLSNHSTPRRTASETDLRTLEKDRKKRTYTTRENATCYCDKCPKMFKRGTNFKSHSATHDRNRPMKACPYEGCSNKFARETDLKRHINSIHERKKDFICQSCKAGFPRNDSSKRHEEHGCLHRKVSKNERTQVPFESRLRSPGAASSSRNY